MRNNSEALIIYVFIYYCGVILEFINIAYKVRNETKKFPLQSKYEQFHLQKIREKSN